MKKEPKSNTPVPQDECNYGVHCSDCNNTFIASGKQLSSGVVECPHCTSPEDTYKPKKMGRLMNLHLMSKYKYATQEQNKAFVGMITSDPSYKHLNKFSLTYALDKNNFILIAMSKKTIEVIEFSRIGQERTCSCVCGEWAASISTVLYHNKYNLEHFKSNH
ncbi:hypothetical protein ACV1C6_21060 [Aeromonas sanarellii]